MEKDCLKSITDTRRLSKYFICAGCFLSIVMGIQSYSQTKLLNKNELLRLEAGEGDYQQEVVASMEGEEPRNLTVLVEEQKFTEAEAEALFLEAENLLEQILKGENQSFSCITENLVFADMLPDLPVEVEWTSKPYQYFYSDGSWREDVNLLEPEEVVVTGMFICQTYTKDFRLNLTLYPRSKTVEEALAELILQQAEDCKEEEVLTLPMEYEGKKIRWGKKMDFTFLYILLLTMVAVVLLKAGEKRDLRLHRQERLEQLERSYPQVISKFTMLLSAGLSVRNAWERIVKIYRKKKAGKILIYEEMSKALNEMEKGTSELEVYENFGRNIGQVHYKKLMSLFISDKRKGSIRLLDAMNQEMLLAWEEEKRKTRQRGEIIGTKLLIPMMGMLSVVFVMILVPAFLSFQL